jgi:hypothetical protein
MCREEILKVTRGRKIKAVLRRLEDNEKCKMSSFCCVGSWHLACFRGHAVGYLWLG